MSRSRCAAALAATMVAGAVLLFGGIGHAGAYEIKPDPGEPAVRPFVAPSAPSPTVSAEPVPGTPVPTPPDRNPPDVRPSPTRARQTPSPAPTATRSPRPGRSRAPSPSPTPTRTPSPTAAPTPRATPTAAPDPVPTGGVRPPTVVTLGFDDTTVDQFAAAALLESVGMRGVYYLTSGWLDAGGDHLTTAQARALQARGHEIGGNTVAHLRLSLLDPVEQRRQICGDRARLLSLGLRVSTLAYPFSDLDATSQVAARECGYNSARAPGGLSCRGCPAAETVPPGSPYRTASVSGLNATTTAEQLEVAVQRAQATGGWLQIGVPRVCSTGPCVGIAAAQFRAFVGWLDTQRRAGAVSVATVRDVLGGAVLPAVPAPAPTVTGTQIVNSSFESPGPTPAGPRCFGITGDAGGFSTRRVADRHSGAWAQEVVVTQATNSTRLQSSQDLGSCAPSILPGHAYRIAFWYKASGPVRIVAATRRPTGAYDSFGMSPVFPAASRWTWAVWTTKGTPATANLALSAGALFTAPGTYVIDDLSVADAGPAPIDASPALAGVDGEGTGPGDLFVPSDVTPLSPAGPAAASLPPSRRFTWLLALEIVAALVVMWGVVVALDRRFLHLHRG